MRIIFMGTPNFALPTLEALQESEHEILAVYTQPPRPAGRGQKKSLSPVHAFALEHTLPVYTPASLKSPEVQAEFAAHKADIAVVVAYGLLLPKPVLQAFPLGCINVHPSLLPRWRGAAPIPRTIMAGDRETGVMIMQMDEGLDTGDILLSALYPIPPGTNAGALHDALAAMAPPLVLQTLHGLANNGLRPVRQDKEGVLYADKIRKEECHLAWDRPADTIYHQILGLSPAPGAYFNYQNEAIKIFAAGWDMKPVAQAPGTVVDAKLGIACNPGIIYPTLLQRPGKSRLPIDALLNGFSIPPGSILS
jgi:methionyl-tRNA formyltransferase